MTVPQIEAHRDRFSDSYKSAIVSIARAEREGKAWLADMIRSKTPWISDFDSMARKTVLIALATKQLPIDTSEGAIAAALDNQEDRQQDLGKVLDMGSLDDLATSPPVDFGEQGDEDETTIDAEPQRSRPRAVENITETTTHVEQQEPETAPRAAPQATKKPPPRARPWFDELGLTGRAFTAGQRALEGYGIDTVEKARAFDWTQIGKVGPATMKELRAALGIAEPEEAEAEAPQQSVPPAPKPAERPPLQRAPAIVATNEDDDGFGFGDIE